MLESIDKSVFEELNMTDSKTVTDNERIKLAVYTFGESISNADFVFLPSNLTTKAVLSLYPERIEVRMQYDRDNNKLFGNNMDECNKAFETEIKSSFYDKPDVGYYTHKQHLFKYKMKTKRGFKYLHIFSPNDFLSEDDLGILNKIDESWEQLDMQFDVPDFQSKLFEQPEQPKPKTIKLELPLIDSEYTFKVINGNVYEIDPTKEYKVIDGVLCHYMPVQCMTKE